MRILAGPFWNCGCQASDWSDLVNADTIWTCALCNFLRFCNNINNYRLIVRLIVIRDYAQRLVGLLDLLGISSVGV